MHQDVVGPLSAIFMHLLAYKIIKQVSGVVVRVDPEIVRRRKMGVWAEASTEVQGLSRWFVGEG